ncbi:7,8-dihydropterin-6-yl-methyl-4-(beta-D-ribofuranosyl)aminobenzene 5'-phosphate synthase [Pseudobutyrivibrio sp. 49]|uniref:MBL fold metallo-hydrolase n=1 Tax=Pseudobutyrivibrio sp. 49 TaxID=1855344 RepID=UPI00088ED4BB|nr:MBL fold metallo-hydrolase [Pseudobutyrivibrio sp. 49]SDH41305.1 7,8-dihydropterin-6-yl-methyl-4-(beta-D-ribofuranosyl)aminobenzene 5'-phosphate synthase [Pseudobutyrivibrio sp. 49]
MGAKITVIVDNISNMGLEGEWGLSLLIEFSDKKILLDTGASNLYLSNLKSLGFDVADIDYGVLSHAHYDHGNGMPSFFKNNSKAKFYLREETLENCYHKRKFFRVYIGIPKHVLRDYPDRIEKVSGDYKLMEGVYLVPHKSEGLSLIGKREKMFIKANHKWFPDDFAHEQSLVLDTKKGLVILNSCSHGGVENIINEVQSTFPEKRIYGYIGGLHLFNKSEEEILSVANTFKEKNIEYICTGHCTKNRAYGILKSELGDKLEQLKVGLEINI